MHTPFYYKNIIIDLLFLVVLYRSILFILININDSTKEKEIIADKI